MQFLKHMYISDNISESEARIKKRIGRKKPAASWFVISVSTMKDGMLDILPAALLGKKWFDNRPLQVVGVANGYLHALALTKQMVEDVYQATGNCSLKEYFQEKMENAKE